MTDSANKLVYSFSAFGGSGTIEVDHTSVRSMWKGFSVGNAVQEFQLADISPEFDRHEDRVRYLSCLLPCALAFAAVSSVILTPQPFLSIPLIVFAVLIAWRAHLRGSNAYIKFNTVDGKSSVIYARNGNNENAFEGFTQDFVKAIKEASCQ